MPDAKIQDGAQSVFSSEVDAGSREESPSRQEIQSSMRTNGSLTVIPGRPEGEPGLSRHNLWMLKCAIAHYHSLLPRRHGVTE